MLDDGCDIILLEDADDYANSVAFDCNLKLHGLGASAVMDAIAAELLERGVVKRWVPSHTEHLDLIIANLYYAYRRDPSQYVAYSRMRNEYYTNQRYNSIGLSYRRMLDIVDGLGPGHLCYIDHKKGIHYKKANFRSRMRATRKLITLINRCAVRRRVLTIRNPMAEVIVLKNNNKKKIDYEDTAETIRMRENVLRLNLLFKKHFIGLCVQDDVLSEMILKMIPPKKRWRFENGREALWGYRDLFNDSLYRVFNNGTFEDGGRFYGGWWQEVPSKYRKYIRIDNMMTCEVDFSEFHPRLLYLLKGLVPPDDDIYELEGISRECRKLVKKLTNIMINVGNPAGALIAIRNERDNDRSIPNPPEDLTDKQIVSAILKKHQAIEEFFFKRFGHKLMRIDSDIAEAVMLSLANKDIVVLPVHDSFIVSRTYRIDLLDAMAQTVIDKYGRTLPYKIDMTAWDEVFEIGIEDEFETVETFERCLDGCDEYLRRLREWEGTPQQQPPQCQLDRAPIPLLVP